MALLHMASLVPSKGDLVAAWLPSRPWSSGAPVVAGVSFRLDDPDGKVGMEGFLLTDDSGVTLHVPLTYRGDPLPGAEQHLLGTMEHSVLGTRWVYDGCADPVWTSTVIATIATGGSQAEEVVDTGSGLETREPAVRVTGSGTLGEAPARTGPWQVDEDHTGTSIRGDGVDLHVVRRVGTPVPQPLTLTATWADRSAPAVLAGLRFT